MSTTPAGLPAEPRTDLSRPFSYDPQALAAAARHIYAGLTNPGTNAHPDLLAPASDGPTIEWLTQAERLPNTLLLAGNLPSRRNIRYLAALLPTETSFTRLAERIHYLLNNADVTFDDVVWVLAGFEREVPIETIQRVGALLRDGLGLPSIAAQLGIGERTVYDIDALTGIRAARHDRLMDHAVAAKREGISVRKFAAAADLSRGAAHTLLNKATAVLIELGELDADGNPNQPVDQGAGQ